jgi:hypothetical protein
MNSSTYAILLKDLQKLEKRIAEAHVASVRGDMALSVYFSERHAISETGGHTDDFVALCARRSAVQFLLRTVYVRVLEDLGALEPARIRGDWGLAAFKEVAPTLGIRSYLGFIFRDLALDFSALFVPGADELDLPGEDLCREVWNLWHHPNKEEMVYDWCDGSFDSHFLGDLYQELDPEVKKRYALLQTPPFIEKYILDRTLLPAMSEFDPAMLDGRGEGLRLIDPTCGSGHFLIGAFQRIWNYWAIRGMDLWTAAEKALASVWGCDINAHAVDIARFRLILEVVARTGEKDLGKIASLKLNLHSMDSLIPWERGERQRVLFQDRLDTYATPAERTENAAFLETGFHVVVGNPPYITPKDVRKRDDYRLFWPESATGKYALSAPFAERFFDLGADGAWVGQITANSFMKRAFGKSLVERVFPKWDLTGVVDTSGINIPGHGTPTVILFGRCRPPQRADVWGVLGKRGDQQRTKDPEFGQVWGAIAGAGIEPDDSSPFVTVAMVPRSTFGKHPWSMGGGEAGGIKSIIEENADRLLGDMKAVSIGNLTKMIEDDVYFGTNPAAWRDSPCPKITLLEGEFVRDWAASEGQPVLYPYEWATPRPLDLAVDSFAFRHFWRYRSRLWERLGVGFKTNRQRGLRFYEYPFYAPHTVTGLGIVFAFVSTHNQFVLDRGGKVFKQSAPVIKLSPNATMDDHFNVLGLLNSSTLGFWMTQVFHSKRLDGEDWETFYEYDSTKLQRAPLTDKDRTIRIALARALDTTAQDRAACLPASILASTNWTPISLRATLDAARLRYRVLTERMVAIQDELDWLTYASYSLIDQEAARSLCIISAVESVIPLTPGHRPFEIRLARLDDEADADEKSAWWSRQGHDRVIEIPAHYPESTRQLLQARLDAIENDPRLQMLESPAYKRRWQTPDLQKFEIEAAERWLLVRLEDLFASPGSSSNAHQDAGSLSQPKPVRLETIVAHYQRDPRVVAVAGVYTRQGPNVDLSLVTEKLLRSHALPDNPIRVYTPEGQRKRLAWKKTWHLQDLEDQHQPIVDSDTGALLDKPPLPPKYDKTDLQSSYFAIRGKLDVPRERFILFADLPVPHYGWNGWRDRDRALAQAEAYTLAESWPDAPLPVPTFDDPRRCGPTLGLWESLPDVKRWFDADTHAELLSLAHEVCQKDACPCSLVERWQAWRRGEIAIGGPTTGAVSAVSVEERAQAITLFVEKLPLVGEVVHDELALEVLAQKWKGPSARLEVVLDDLVATGDLVVKGRGQKRRYTKMNDQVPRR